MSLLERHDLVGVGQVTARVLHLRRVGVADFVVGAAVVGALDHDDVGPRAAQLDGVALARQLPPHHRHGHGRAAERWRERERERERENSFLLNLDLNMSKVNY